jgi:hypothetical protein
MSSKEKPLQYFKNQVTGYVPQSFQHFKSESPTIPTILALGSNAVQPFALHIKNNSFEARKTPPPYRLMHVEKSEAQRDCETVKILPHPKFPWKAITSPSPNPPATSLKDLQVQTGGNNYIKSTLPFAL